MFTCHVATALTTTSVSQVHVESIPRIPSRLSAAHFGLELATEDNVFTVFNLFASSDWVIDN